MLAHAVGRTLRRHGARTPAALSSPLTLQRLCPAQLRHTATLPSITSHTQSSRSRPRQPLPPHHNARSLATTAELQPTPTPAPLPFDPFAAAWGVQEAPPAQERLQPWHMDPIVIRDQLAASPTLRQHHGMGADPRELHQNLYACLRVGRLDRAAFILERLGTIYVPSAPEMVDAHNVYLQTLLGTEQQDPKDASMSRIEQWYEVQMVRRGVEPNAHTFVTMVRAAMSFLGEGSREEAVQRYMAMALKYGPDVVDDINASPDFTDEEWDMLIRAQPDAFEEPPTVHEVQDLLVSTPSGRKSLIEHGLFLHPAQAIKSVPQKGVGLDSLKQALSTLDNPESVPYPEDMEGTQQEKDQAYAYARQLRIEKDSVDAAVDRWKLEDDNLKRIGIHGVLNSKPLQAIMYNWYTALIPLFKKQIAHSKKILSAPIAENPRDPAHGYGPWLEQCKPEWLAGMTVARVMQSCVRSRKEDGSSLKISALTVGLGSSIQNQLEADVRERRDAFLKKLRKETRRDLLGKLSKAVPASDPPQKGLAIDPFEYSKTDIPLPMRTKLGALCLELLLQSARMTVTVDDPRTGKQLSNTVAVFHHQIGFHQGKKTGYVVPHHELMLKLRTEPVHDIQTVKLPMVLEPKPWSSFDDGGYYTVPSKVIRQKSSDHSQKSYAQAAIENGDMDQVLKGLDVLGKVPWQINNPVLAVMTEAWNSGEGIGGLIPEDTKLERPVEPAADAPYRERFLWNQALKKYENEKSGFHSQRCFQNFQLETARAYAGEQKIFFPHSVDFRGRAYPIPPILNHMGADMPRGLLKFAHGKELGAVGLQWLKIHLANLYGFDKASLREREQFAMDHMDEVVDSATNSLNGRRWWAKAEDPWQCLACCMELKAALDLPDPTRFVSQLPVHQDGTCNGLQHYAALGGDHAGARQVNLEPSDRPQDIYTGVAELVKEMVAEDAAKGYPYASFVNGHITRKVVKRTVMTNVYGVTFMGAKLQVLDELEQIFPNFQPSEKVKTLHAVALYIATRIFEALGKIFNGAQEIQYWLGECGERITTSLSAEQVKKIQARFNGEALAAYDPKFQPPKKISATMTSKANKDLENFKTSIIWTTPLKMPIVQPYRKDGTMKVSTKIQEISIMKKSHLDVVDKRRQLQGFPPNFIHSLDATHMILSALKCSEMGLDFAAVHDSFWTHASDIPNLNTILRDAFVRMHSEDIIDRLAAEFSTRYAGAMFRASIAGGSTVAKKINRWRRQMREQALAKDQPRGRGAPGSFRDAPFAEIALEAKRQELLKSEDPEERRKGEEMETPTSIWLANQDPRAFASPRLKMLGEFQNKKSKDRQEQVRDKILSAEAEAVEDEGDEGVGKVESTVTLEEDNFIDKDMGPEADADPLAYSTRGRTSKDGTLVWIPLTFPPVPKKGGWDVSRLRESKYFFS